MVHWCGEIFVVYFRGLDALSKKVKASTVDLPIESVSLSLQDLIGYFHPPDEHLEHEDKQNRLRALKNRQNLFQEEVSFCEHSFLSSSWGNNFLVSDILYPFDYLHIEVHVSRCATVQGEKRIRPWRNPAVVVITLSISINFKRWHSSCLWQKTFLFHCLPSLHSDHCRAVVCFTVIIWKETLTMSKWTQSLKSTGVFTLFNRFTGAPRKCLRTLWSFVLGVDAVWERASGEAGSRLPAQTEWSLFFFFVCVKILYMITFYRSPLLKRTQAIIYRQRSRRTVRSI